jgi:hypothetical protein
MDATIVHPGLARRGLIVVTSSSMAVWRPEPLVWIVGQVRCDVLHRYRGIYQTYTHRITAPMSTLTSTIREASQ